MRQQTASRMVTNIVLKERISRVSEKSFIPIYQTSLTSNYPQQNSCSLRGEEGE